MMRMIKRTGVFLLIFCLSLFSVNSAFAAPNDYHHLLKKTKQAAKVGKVINSQFSLGTAKEKILKKYGPADYEDSNYLFYSQKQVGFLLDENKRVNKVLTEYEQLLTVTTEQVEEVLGAPKCAEGGWGKAYWTYQVGKNALIFQWRNNEVKKLEQVHVEKFDPQNCVPVNTAK